MVKLDFDTEKYFSQIIGLKFLGKIFETLIKVQLDRFPAVQVPIENCSFHPIRLG